MDSKDTEMETDMEMETSSSGNHGLGVAAVPNQQHIFHGNVIDLLARARCLISQGKPSLALQAVVMAVKSEGGDEAVARIVQRARDMYLNKLQANDAIDHLASLFTECAIADAQPKEADMATTSVSRVNPTRESSVAFDSEENSILAESGREQIVFDAYVDGSSFVCLKCGGLVSTLRREEHLAYWCRGPT